ncbi:hypothetical protein Ssi03_48990 [Sphaerisporangium siamense]|uniref:DUF1707 domain-containing protein n=1 Tax=Sphaerisporangium siamense TaxID=795645 RepID=A0A7W7D3M3_9ACTN|nr:DUF1707 domain-containing protein [Sphaerisporangium siamense]MBB4699496.1 hypothetical protein [Sphaerisporangium siamense]GII86909.1 hypothetical protein Ssi03_48990 [Sphaerisporangium siamense]
MSDPEARVSEQERDRVVELVQRAYADGRLGAADLERWLERALGATTSRELEPVVADLPGDPDDVVHITTTGGRVTRTGDWHVPRRLRIDSEYGRVRLDLSSAHVPHPRIDIELRLGYGGATIILPAGASANADGVRTDWGKVTCKAAGRQIPGRLHVHVTGELPYGRLTIRTARR